MPTRPDVPPTPTPPTSERPQPDSSPQTSSSCDSHPAIACYQPALNGRFASKAIDVAAMPVEKQGEAVSKKLVELNPSFDGMLWDHGYQTPPRIEQSVVVSLRIRPEQVTEISPRRALAGLRKLRLFAMNNRLSQCRAFNSVGPAQSD